MKLEIETVTNLDLPDTSEGRSIGVHQSSIIKCIAGESGLLRPEYCEELELIPVSDINSIPMRNKLMIHLGLAWERYYIPLMTDVVDHPPEACMDDIYMSPDGESIDLMKIDRRSVYYTRVHEVKLTYKSTRTVGRLDNTGYKSAFMWLAQIKGYCRAAKTRYATLHVFFVCGDYRPPSPLLKRFYLEFTDEELDDNWKVITDYRDYKLALALDGYQPVSLEEWSTTQ
jgi:hypothetical protein